MNIGSAFSRPALRVVVIALLLLPAGPRMLSAQQLTGRVQRAGEGLPGHEVVLHRVTRDSAGTAARTVSDAQGRFSISLPPADTAGFTVYFATVEYLGVRYFGSPLHPGEPIGDYAIAVYDTVSISSPDAPALRLARRDVVMLPETDGGWEVNEVIQLMNASERTIVAPAGGATWEFPIPHGAAAFELGEGEIAASDVVRVGDRALLLIPLLPGRREVFVRYRIPSKEGELRLPVGTQADSLKLFVHLPAPDVAVTGLVTRPPVQTEAGDFLSFAGSALPPNATVIVAWNGAGNLPISPTAAAVAIVTALLLLGTVAAVFLRPRSSPEAGSPRSRSSHGADVRSVEPVA